MDSNRSEPSDYKERSPKVGRNKCVIARAQDTLCDIRQMKAVMKINVCICLCN